MTKRSILEKIALSFGKEKEFIGAGPSKDELRAGAHVKKKKLKRTVPTVGAGLGGGVVDYFDHPNE